MPPSGLIILCIVYNYFIHNCTKNQVSCVISVGNIKPAFALTSISMFIVRKDILSDWKNMTDLTDREDHLFLYFISKYKHKNVNA